MTVRAFSAYPRASETNGSLCFFWGAAPEQLACTSADEPLGRHGKDPDMPAALGNALRSR
jgi:hypothetical protein